jgi:Zn-dependent M32 family carboxypeptidase
VEALKQKAHYIDPTKPAYEVEIESFISFKCLHHSDKVLLDEYERGMTVSQLDNVFATLKCDLIPLIHRIQTSENKPEISFLRGHLFPADVQAKLNHHLAQQLGFDTQMGRLDVNQYCFYQISTLFR